MTKLTPAQRVLLKQLKVADMPVGATHTATADGLARRGLVERYITTRTVTVEMLRLVDGGAR